MRDEATGTFGQQESDLRIAEEIHRLRNENDRLRQAVERKRRRLDSQRLGMQAQEQEASSPVSMVQALDLLPIVLWEYDARKDLLRAPRFHDIFAGCSSSPIRSLDDLLERVHEEDRARTRNLILKLRGGGNSHGEIRGTFRIPLPSGETRFAEILGRNDSGRRGREGSCSGVLVDITDRAYSEKAIERNERLLRGALHGSPSGAGIVRQRRFVNVNDSFCRLVGYRREELIGSETKFLYPSLKEYRRLGRLREEVLQDQEMMQTETKMRRKDGRLIDVILSLNRLGPWDENAEETFTIMDISERRNAERALLASERRFREMISMLPEIFYEANTRGEITFANDNAIRVTGHDYDDLFRGIPALELLVPEDREKAAAQIRKMLRGEQVPRTQYGVLRQDGSSFPALIQSSPILRKGQVVGFRGIIMDVTELTHTIERLTETQAALKRKEEQILQTLEQERHAMNAFVATIVQIIESKDPYTAGHQQRVGQLGEAIARKMGMSEEQVEGVRISGLIHDLGKISLPTEILSMPRKLSDIEYDLIKKHPEVSYAILKDLGLPWPVAEVALQHHERLDGSGYPRGIPGKEMRLESKIIAVADVVEAMAYHRPYRPALGLDVACEEIRRGAGVLYDPEVVRVCCEVIDAGLFAGENP